MKPAEFGYVRPASVAEAVGVLAEHEGLARVLAGGQSLVPMLGMRLMRPSALVDVNGLGDELGRIDGSGAQTTIGALVRYAELESSPVIAERLPLVQQAVRFVGDRQVRNRGTLGGAIAQSDPTGEMALVSLVLGAEVVARSVRGERAIAIEDFFVGSYASALEADELLVAVRFGSGPAHCRFFEVNRKHNDFALLSVAVVGGADPDGRWRGVRIGLGGVDDRPRLATASAALLEGERWTPDLIAAAAALAADDIDPPDDVRASAEYRRHLVPVHVRRLLTDLAGGGASG